jgi:hypothetical protein
MVGRSSVLSPSIADALTIALLAQPARGAHQPAASSPPAVVNGCGGPTHIFQKWPMNVPGEPDNETVLEQQAISAVVQQHPLPASEATHVMHA